VQEFVLPPATSATGGLPNRTTHVLEAVAESFASQTAGTATGTSLIPVTATPLNMYEPEDVSVDQVSPVDRAQFHLCRRTDETVTFDFENKQEDSQHIDHEILLAASPHYAHFAADNPGSPVQAPKDFTRKTVNTFIQLISPVRGTSIPTHYL
jgi:hypothetical protein